MDTNTVMVGKVTGLVIKIRGSFVDLKKSYC